MPCMEIPLTGELVALADPEDYKLLSQYKWYALNDGYTTYAARMDENHKQVYMHQFIMGSKGIDHRNHDGLDNRRSNLRVATIAENNRNRRKFKRTASGYKGVYKCRNRWQATICVNYRKINLGSFKTPEEAAIAYDEAAKVYHGEFANLNFSLDKERV